MIKVRFETLWFGPTHVGEKTQGKAVDRKTGKILLGTMGRRYRAYAERGDEYILSDDFLPILPKTAKVFEVSQAEADGTLTAEEMRVKARASAKAETHAGDVHGDLYDPSERAEAKEKAEAFKKQLEDEARAEEERKQANRDRMAKVRAARGKKPAPKRAAK